MNEKPKSKTKPLTAEILENLRDQARSYYKLDLTYIAAVGAAVTALRIERPAIFKYLASGAPYAYWLMGLIFFDTLFASWLNEHWIDVKNGNNKFTFPIFTRFLAGAQPIAHGLFVIFTLTAIVAQSQGFYDSRNGLRLEAKLQTAVEDFQKKHGEYPESISELERSDNSVPELIRQIQPSTVTYKRIGSNDYQLTFSYALSTPPVVMRGTHEIQLKDVLKLTQNETPF